MKKDAPVTMSKNKHNEKKRVDGRIINFIAIQRSPVPRRTVDYFMRVPDRIDSTSSEVIRSKVNISLP